MEPTTRPPRPRPDPRELAAIFAGGALGAMARAEVEAALPTAGGAWPWATLLVNLAGAFVLGWAVVVLPRASCRRSFVGIGVCGGLTTFSTLQLELLHLLDAGRAGVAVVYGTTSLVLGLGAALAGTGLARRSRWAP